MEKYLVNISVSFKMYTDRKQSIAESSRLINVKSPTAKKTIHLFRKNFLLVKKQVHAYRDLINSILKQENIDTRIEHVKTSAYISNQSAAGQEELGDYYILFAIAQNVDEPYRRFRRSGFLAFCGDPETYHINVYEYTELGNTKPLEDLRARRRAFKEHSKHLIQDRIEKFNIEEVIPYMERYIDKELENMMNRVRHPKSRG